MAEWTSVPVESSCKGTFLNSSCKVKFTRRNRETLAPEIPNPKKQKNLKKETYSGRISEGSKRSNLICVKVSVPGNT